MAQNVPAANSRRLLAVLGSNVMATSPPKRKTGKSGAEGTQRWDVVALTFFSYLN